MKYIKIILFIIPVLFALSILSSSHTEVFAQKNTTTGYSNYDFGPKVYAPDRNSQTPTTSNLGKQSFAQLTSNFVIKTGEYVIRFFVALSVFIFLYGIMKYMFKGQGSDTARTEGRKLMLWGIIGLFAITSIWGLVAITASIIGHNDIVTPQFRK